MTTPPLNATHIIGIMSGTSLDGMDLAYCRFSKEQPTNFEIVHTKTISYTPHWLDELRAATKCSGAQLAKLHAVYAGYVASCVNEFIGEQNLPQPDLLGFHGHTIFHQPEIGFTFQLGSGAVLAAKTGIDTVSDFRTANVALGGQGAPLVPIGDAHLFGEFDTCLNLGGFCNASFREGEQIIAFDICPANIALNEWAQKAGKNYDNQGAMAARGKVDEAVLKALNSLRFYQSPPPRSLGREWYEHAFGPILNQTDISINDALATLSEHIAIQIAAMLNPSKSKNVLVTGGGAHNTHLMERIQSHLHAEIVVPHSKLIDYKEALIFAYLAFLQLNNKPNILASYSGSRKNHCAGTLHRG